MTEEVSGAAPEERLELAHVLFLDLVGYSVLPMEQQREYLVELQQIVHVTAQFQNAE